MCLPLPVLADIVMLGDSLKSVYFTRLDVVLQDAAAYAWLSSVTISANVWLFVVLLLFVLLECTSMHTKCNILFVIDNICCRRTSIYINKYDFCHSDVRNHEMTNVGWQEQPSHGQCFGRDNMLLIMINVCWGLIQILSYLKMWIVILQYHCYTYHWISSSSK